MNRVGGGGDGEWRSQEKDVNRVEGGGSGGAGGGAEGEVRRVRSSPTGGERAEKQKSE